MFRVLRAVQTAHSDVRELLEKRQNDSLDHPECSKRRWISWPPVPIVNLLGQPSTKTSETIQKGVLLM